MGSVWNELDFSSLTTLFGSGLALMILSVTLVRVIKGSKHRFVITILSMLMLANLDFLGNEIMYINILKTEASPSSKKYEIVGGIEAFGMLLFNVGHWMFSQKYFKMARQVPFKLAKREVPRNVVLCDQLTNWVFLTLNAIPPTIYGVTFIYLCEALENGNMELYL